LSVNKLHIIGSMGQNDIEKLSSIECNLTLRMDCVAVERMYQLLERIGRFVKTLTIGDMYKPRIVYIESEIIVERLLVACPNLEHFDFNCNQPLVLDKRYDLPPSAFKNYQQ
jgi:hypothetical protein